MPRKYVRRAQRFNKRYSKHLGTAQRALNVAQAVSKLINVEFKSHLASPANTCSTTVTITNLTAIAQGDDFDDRDGNKIRVKSLSLRGNMRMSESATQTRARIMIIRDNNGSTTAPLIGDLFLNAAAYTGNRHKLSDPQTNSRFTVLLDKTFDMSDNGRKVYCWKYYKQLDHHAFFTGPASTDEGKGSLWVFSGSSEATNVPINEIDAIVKFIDN